MSALGLAPAVPVAPDVATLELVIIERGGMRLGVPAARVSSIDELARSERRAPLQEQLGQPPLADDERCVGLCIDGAAGAAMIEVAGRISIAAVPVADLAPLPELLAGIGLVTAVVFAGDGEGEGPRAAAGEPVIVLDVEALIAQAGAAE